MTAAPIFSKIPKWIRSVRRSDSVLCEQSRADRQDQRSGQNQTQNPALNLKQATVHREVVPFGGLALHHVASPGDVPPQVLAHSE